jgi:hypothetical protein
MVVNNNGIYGGLDNDLYYEITNEAEQPSSITRQEIDQWFSVWDAWRLTDVNIKFFHSTK